MVDTSSGSVNTIGETNDTSIDPKTQDIRLALSEQTHTGALIEATLVDTGWVAHLPALTLSEVFNWR